MGTGMRLDHAGRGAIRVIIGAVFITGMAAGCQRHLGTDGGSPGAVGATAVTSVSAVADSGGPAPTVTGAWSAPGTSAAPGAGPGATTSQSATTPPAATGSVPATQAPAQAPSRLGGTPPLTAPTTPAGTSPSAAPAPPTGARPPTTPAAPTGTRPPTAPVAGAAFTASCPDHASSDAPGCGSWDAGAASGQAPGFAAGQQSSPNLLGVNQDPWSGSQGSQVLAAASFDHWSVTATDTDPANAPGEVLTYPNASFNYYQLFTAGSGYTAPPAQYDLTNITSLTSDFTESMPQLSGLDAEAAYDLWLNNWKTEVMVWVDTSPAEDRNLADEGMTDVGTYSYGGQNFTLWRSGSGITGFYVFLLDHNETSGTVDLKAMLETLVSLGYIPAASSLTQIPFGWEVSDTGGKPVTFTLSRFDVNLQN